jgi:hypothetical protein
MCIASTAVMVAGVTSSGGLTALAVKYLQLGNVVTVFKNKKKPAKENDNGNFSYEQDRKSESDITSAVAGGTQGAVEQGEGIHEAA